jgi:hypothetical protein
MIHTIIIIYIIILVGVIVKNSFDNEKRDEIDSSKVNNS